MIDVAGARTARARSPACASPSASRICHSSSAEPIFLMPIAAACERGFRTQGGADARGPLVDGGVVHDVDELGAADRRRCARGRASRACRGTRAPSSRPCPGTCRYSRSIAAVSTSKSSSATMRSSRSVRARIRRALPDVAARACRGGRSRTRRWRRAASRRRAAFPRSGAGRGSPGGGTPRGTRPPLW